MSILFETTSINGMTLKNRFVRSATWEGMATDDGTCTEKLVNVMAELAQGGVGLIITSHAYVEKRGQAGPWQLGIYKDDHLSELFKMTKAVHKKGAKIIMQLAHAGLYADTKLTGEAPWAPSAMSGFTKTLPQELGSDEIHEVVAAFGLAAKRAKSAGFDGVQIHAAHGYLMDQFLSPAYNQRRDRYGGMIENRVTILLEVVNSIRMHVGSNYPVLIKMNSRDFMQGGLELEESVKAGALLESAGIDAIEISGGTKESGKLNPIRTGIVSEDQEAYFKDAAIAFREKVNLPLILVGGIRSFDVARQIVQDNIADYISMSRPFIREPGLINRWKSGDTSKATCVSDSKCFLPIRSGKGMYCVVKKRLQDKKSKD